MKEDFPIIWLGCCVFVCGGWKVSEEETNAFSVVQMDGMD